MADIDIVYCGTGQRAPVIEMLHGFPNAMTAVVVSRFPRGYSVYALAVSPAGRRLAAGTRTGLLRVHDLTDGRGIEDSPAVFEMYTAGSVGGLAFSTEEILACGTPSGVIQLWSLVEQRQVGQIAAHPGPVVALCCLGSLLLASLGADGQMRIWDLDTLKPVYESDKVQLPTLTSLVSLDYNPINGLLMHPSATGKLHIYDVQNAFHKRVHVAHAGPFVALCSGRTGILTGGLDDQRLCLWSPDAQQRLCQSSVSAGVLSVAWAGTQYAVSVLRNGSAVFWIIRDDEWVAVGTRDGDMRSCTGLPPKALAEKVVRQERRWRDEQIAEARSLIPASESQQMHRFRSIIEHLSGRGFCLEASLLVAEAAQEMDRPLWELEIRLAQVKTLGDSTVSLPCRYALAQLLEAVNEPDMALAHYQQIAEIQDDYKDVRARIAILNTSGRIAGDNRHYVRSDITPIETLPQEIQKYALLGKAFCHPVLCNKGKRLSIKMELSVNAVFECIRDSLEDSGHPGKVSEPRDLDILQADRWTTVPWVSVQQTNEAWAFACAVKVIATGSTTELTVYAMFNPPCMSSGQSESVYEFNDRVAGRWQSLSNNWLQAEQWYNQTQDRILKAIERLANANQQRHSQF